MEVNLAHPVRVPRRLVEQQSEQRDAPNARRPGTRDRRRMRRHHGRHVGRNDERLTLVVVVDVVLGPRLDDRARDRASRALALADGTDQERPGDTGAGEGAGCSGKVPYREPTERKGTSTGARKAQEAIGVPKGRLAYRCIETSSKSPRDPQVALGGMCGPHAVLESRTI